MKNTVLELHITNSGKFNFYPHELDLTEGISQLSEACLTVYTSTAFSMSDLQKLISTFATIKITQKNDANQFIARFFTGVISSVRHCGVAQRTDEQTVCKYQLIIQSPLAQLQYAFPRRYSTSISLGDLVTQILNDHNIVGAVPENVAKKVHPYFQDGCSDYEFLLRLLAEYDLNYMFKSLAAGDSEPEMHIFNTAPVLASEVIINDQTLSEPQTLNFHCHNARENIFVMNSWEMSQSMGVDGVDIHYADTFGMQSSISSGEDGSARKKVFNSMPFNAMEKEEAARIAKSLLARIESSKTIWQGTTGYLVAVPGMTLNVAEFDNSKETVTALVTAAHLQVMTPWPSEFGVAPDPDMKQYLNVQIRCCAPDANTNLIASPESDTTAIVSGMFFNSNTHKTHHADGPGAELIVATVCNSAGAITPKNGKAPLILKGDEGTDDTYTFYAIAENATMLLVHLTMPIGGYKQGLFRVPRLGERVLLQGDGSGQYYLLSYLPNKTNMPFADELNKNIEDAAEMITLRHVPVTDTDSELPDPSPTPHDKTDTDIITDTGSDKYAVNSPNNSSEISIHPPDASLKKPDETKRATDPEAFEEQVEAYEAGQARIEIASMGNIRLSANNNTQIQAKNIEISTPGWARCSANGYAEENGEIKLTNFNDLVVEAAKSITLQVGNNMICLTKSGIMIRALKWSESTGPMDAAIYMDGLAGVDINGATCSMTGAFGVDVSDSVGAGMSVFGGTTNISGGDLTLETLDKATTVSAAMLCVQQLLLQIASFIAPDKSKTVLSDINYGIESVGDMVIGNMSNIKELHQIRKARTKPKRAWLTVLTIACQMCHDVIEMLWMVIEACGADWLEDKINDKTPNITKRDIFRLLSFGFLLTAWGLTLGAVIFVAMKGSKYSRIGITPKKIDSETPKNSILSKEELRNIGFLAGVQMRPGNVAGQGRPRSNSLPNIPIKVPQK